ncbi:toprim domain-containing protein [Rhodoferax sp.]|uniref:toprim domain-containing protein n=1 Tax=Rhodoferax sp. TaxID=50421 RepID=UPI0027214A75|nr:toprim domain-containing protein [Rhodoferax sp.]MDO8320606.1 toprim domain-containing protein [Rhodoferax sp.]
MANTIQDAMALAGLAPHKVLDIPDNGKLTRYRVTGDKAGSVNGWAVLHGGDHPAGAFGSWKTGESHTWQQAHARPSSAAALATQRRQRAELHQALKAEREAVQTAARAKAQKLWSRARPAFDSHPYLRKKRVRAYGIRQLRDMLLIPARDVNGRLNTLQFISADGTKRFLTGGQIAGCYFAIGKPVDRLLLAEGLATGSTLHQATGAAVAVCFSCGNLLAVALALRSKFPRLRLVLCADNDTETPGNPGVTKAREAAKAVGGYLAVPVLSRWAYPCPF